MKCRSIVGIWPATPPSHRVTAVAVIQDPPSLYTGASDGSVVWWHFPGDPSSSKIKPVAMLCGHASAIADFCICFPLSASLGGNLDHGRDLGVNDSPGDQVVLVSACSDGVLCVWSRGSGHCRRRRKLPPWVGSPSMIQMLPSNKRYICVASCSTDHEYLDSNDGIEVSGDQESSSRKAPKCTIVIVDSCTLTIVQTVFHGHLSIGPLKYMTLVESVDDNQKHSVIVIDFHGKIQFIPLVKDSNLDKKGLANLHGDSSLVNTAIHRNGSSEGGLLVSVASCSMLIALVYRTRCVFISVLSSSELGSIVLESNAHNCKADLALSHALGSMFISSDDTCTSQSAKRQNVFDVDFVVWDERGLAIIYKISVRDNIFNSAVICAIPAISLPMDVNISINFVQLSQYLFRVESIRYNNEEPFLWRPRITIWSLQKLVDGHKNFYKTCKLLGEGDFCADWLSGSSHSSKASEYSSVEEPIIGETGVMSIECPPGQEDRFTSCKDHSNYNCSQKERVVSSTMVISQNAHLPYAVVYGYHSGEIELVHFNLWAQTAESDGVSMFHDMESQGSQQWLLGHTGSVLCLAAHQMVSTANNIAYSKVLLSGGMDCTLRLWDLETCNPIMVMHHHVAPVRQIILPPLQTDCPWNDCFVSVGEDSCVALVSLETLHVERMFPGHPGYPAQVIWDGVRGYLACLSHNPTVASNAKDALYIWDIKAGSRERVLRGTAAHSMFSNFSKGNDTSNASGFISNYNTSTSSLTLPLTDDGVSLPSRTKSSQSISSNDINMLDNSTTSVNNSWGRSVKLRPGDYDRSPIRCFCPYSGIAVLSFDLPSLLSGDICRVNGGTQQHGIVRNPSEVTSSFSGTVSSDSTEKSKSCETAEEPKPDNSLEIYLLGFSLSFMHLWDVDTQLDNLLMMAMNARKNGNLNFAPGLEGDRGSTTLSFPALSSTLQLWKSSSEFCALRSLIMVSLAQSMVSLSHSCSAASSALSAFYTRNFAEKIPDLKPPSLQLLVSFWQDEDEHVRMAARSLFHCAASRAIPPPLFCPRTTNLTEAAISVDQVRGSKLAYASGTETKASAPSPLLAQMAPDIQGTSENEEAGIVKWLDSCELLDWISCVDGTSQDAMASHIIVAAALAIWYPSLVKPTLAMLVVHPLIKLVMAMNEKYSSTAAELLAEGMDCTWKTCIGAEIHRLIGDIFFQIECVSGASSNITSGGAAVPPKLRETLVGVLLPSLALADIPGFLSVIEGLIWSTASDSPVHLVSLKTLIRLMRGSPKNLAQYLHKVVNFILQTIDPANSVMRKTCIQSSMATLREVVRVYPMVALNDTSTRLAVGDAIAEAHSAIINVYDMQSVAKIKVLDASGPPGLPTLLSGSPETVTVAISALSFSPDGEGLVAFSEHGLMIRWWSLGTAWWEKLSRNFVPVQCTKLIFVPPWEGFSPNSSRASIMANITGNYKNTDSQEHKHSGDVDSLNLLLYNLDLSYRLEWIEDRRVRLSRHGQEIETLPL